MRIISFSWTTPALLAGEKTVTRRDWADNYAKGFRAGDLVAAYDRSQRIGGRQVATIRLTRDPYREGVQDIPEEDWYGEGFEFFRHHPSLLPSNAPRWMKQLLRSPNPRLAFKYACQGPPTRVYGLVESLWVVRFELVKTVNDGGAWP